jgi:eukaryotic-like serine/threonine-protein kinase
MRFAIKGTTVLVPVLMGQSAAEASSLLANRGLGMHVVGAKPQAGTAPGIILNQEPIAGTPVKPRQMVRVVISSGEKRDPTPKVIGASLRIAQNSILRAGRNIGDVSRIHLGSEGASEVLCQSPMPEEASIPNGLVHLLVNAGEEEPGYIMPDLIGHDVNEVIRLFESSGIRIESISYRSDSGFTIGQVLDQHPDRGHRLSRQISVKIVVSR